MTEQTIIAGCLHNDAIAQRELYNRYSPKMLSVCYRFAQNREDAEDMLQEGFIRIFNHLNQFKSEGSFEGWMRRIVVNVCLKIIKNKRINFSTDDDFGIQIPDSSTDAPSHLSEDELLRLIKRLPTGYRIIFNLHAIEGFSHDEIGDMLKIKASTSRSQLVKARKMLQQQIINLQKIAV